MPLWFLCLNTKEKREKNPSEGEFANLIFIEAAHNHRCLCHLGKIESESINMGKGKYKKKLELRLLHK